MKNSILWGWVPEAIKATAAALERICMIPQKRREAQVKNAGLILDLIERAREMGLSPAQTINLLQARNSEAPKSLPEPPG